MRKLYNEFFYIPKHGKIREKVMLTRVAMTITIVIMCLAAMSITAYAYFTANDIVSPDNYIKSAKYELDIAVNDGENDVILTNNQFVAAAGKTYTITITPIKDQKSAKTGFVIVKADNCPDVYYTQQLGKDEKVDGGETNILSFKVMLTDSTTVYLIAHWGTSSYYADFQNKSEELYITQSETIKLIVNGFNEPNVKKEESSKEADGSADGTSSDTAETTTPPSSTTPVDSQTNPSASESTTPPTTVTNPSTSTETSESINNTDPATTETTTTPEQTEPPATTETQSTEESVDTPTTEASE